MSGEKRLILLSRGNDKLLEGNRPDCSLRWLDLSIQLQRAAFAIRPSKSSLLLEDYLSFLGTKQMKLNAVSEHASRSIAEVGTILTQLKLACDGALIGAQLKLNKDYNWIGYVLRNPHCVGSIGFNLADPQWLFYTTDGAEDAASIDPELARNSGLSTAELIGKYWVNCIDLVDCRDYLTASAADQVEYLRRHIEESLRAFRAMIASPSQV